MPYDSIGNPLNGRPQTDRTVQAEGDKRNMQLSRIRLNQAGYRQVDVAAQMAKFYYLSPAGTSAVFQVVPIGVAGGTSVAGTMTAKGGIVGGKVTAYASNSAEHQANGVGDYKAGYPMTSPAVTGTLLEGTLPPGLTPGKYRIVIGGADSSHDFVVSDNVYGMARDASLMFMGVARSGEYESWFHPASHMWDGWLYDSAAKNPDGSYKYKGALTGGWYDCGNHLKEARTNSYPLATLGMLAATMPEKTPDHFALNQSFTRRTDGIPDILREAWVGAQFVFKSYRLANGKTADMMLSVGDPIKKLDFMWWGRPENQDNVLSVNRGGRRERAVEKNWGTPSMADFAAGMAFLGKLYKPYDAGFADSALMIAKAMYKQAIATNQEEGPSDYYGETNANDDLAFAAVALLWATGDKAYLQDLAYTPGMVDGLGKTCAATQIGVFPGASFAGGFMGCGPNNMAHGVVQLSWANVHDLALYSFMKLILKDDATAAVYGITSAERLSLYEKSLANLTYNIADGSAGPSTLALPAPAQGMGWKSTSYKYDSLWYSSAASPPGWWTKYQFGNLASLYLYYDATSAVEGVALPHYPATTDWKRKDVLKVLLGGLDYMFGRNAVDVSYLLGVGDKNPNHPHHRAADPEGRNVPGAYYNYSIPVGALYGGPATGPTGTEVLIDRHADNGTQYTVSEANCPDATAAVIIPLTGLALPETPRAPVATVKVLYTTDTLAAIQVDLDKWGFSSIRFGLDSALTKSVKIVKGSDTSNSIRFLIGGLTPATQYYFEVTSSDLQGNVAVVSKWPNGQSDSIPFSFTTKPTPPVPPVFGNIKVCNVTSDSAEIMWYTPNGEYFSSVLWADSASWKVASYKVTDSDMVGDVPVKFHHVKLYGLKPKTTYYFKVGSQGAYDAVVNCFRTPNEDVKFDIRATQYVWGGMRALSLGIVNQDKKAYDSLSIRLYIKGTKDNVWDLGARCDIGIKYRSDGFQDSAFKQIVDNQLRKSHPQKIDPTCSDASECDWYFDIPINGAQMESQSRFRIDVVWDKHKVELNQQGVLTLYDDLMNAAPTHDVFAAGTKDWSFKVHLAGGDGGMSPVAYDGVPVADKNALDDSLDRIPVNPYVAVYRRNDFVYGFSPFSQEQSTKRTVFVMDAALDAPFNLVNGSTIQIATGTSTHLTGKLDVYDQLVPGAKGYITSIWVNGVALTAAERKAALARQTDGTWKVDLPLRFVTGTNKLDVTFFAGADSVEEVATGACDEGKGCAFFNANWYVNYVSNMTPSLLSVVDGMEAPVGLVVPDSSTLRVRVKDGNANLSKTVADVLTVSVTNQRTLAKVALLLPETGVSTGVFQTDLLKVVSSVPVAGQLQMLPGDTLVVRYMDASDSADVGEARIWSKTAWPSLVSGAIVKTCAGGIVRGRFDSKLGVQEVLGVELVQNAGFENPAATSVAEYYGYTGKHGAWSLSNIDLVSEKYSGMTAAEGDQSVDLNAKSQGQIWQILATTPGAPVRLSLRYSMNNEKESTDPLGPRTAKVTWNGVVVDTLKLIGSDPRVWKSASYELVATGRDSINIAAINPGNGGVMVDDISLKTVTSGSAKGGSIQSGALVVMGAAGDTVHAALLSASDIDLGADGTTVGVAVPDRATFGVAGGTLSVTLKLADGKLVTSSAALVDSIGPWIDSAKIVENLSGNPVDTLYLWASEATRPLGKTLPIQLKRGTLPMATAGLVVDDARLVDASIGKWVYAIRGGVVKAKDSLRWNPSLVSDPTGNPALDCPSLLREVKLLSRPAPFSRAWIDDVDGDGRADRVTMVFRKPLVAGDLPDSIQVGFGATGSVRLAPVSLAMATDSVLSVPLPVPFLLSQTRGTAVDGSGNLLAWKTGEAAGPYPLLDSVGPALLSAKLIYGNVSSVTDTIELAFSEAVAMSAGTGWLAWKQAPGYALGVASSPVMVASTVWRLPVDTNLVSPGDSVRPLAAGRWVDSVASNRVAVAHPWVLLTGGERAPTGGWYQDLDGDGAVDLATVVFAKTPKTRSAMQFLWPSALGSLETVTIDSGAWVLNPDGKTASIAVGPFAKGVTSSASDQLGRWISNGVASPFAMADLVPPVIVSASLRYAAESGSPDTLRVRWSEPLGWVAGPLVFHRNDLKGVPVQDVSFANLLRDPDGLGATLFLDSTSTILRRGDSARLAPPVGDAFGNVAGAATVWVPVVFGLRPPRLETRLKPFVEWDGIRPFFSAKPFETWLWEQGVGDEGRWIRPDGTPVLDTVDAHFLGLTLTLNQFLEGFAYIYDNGGVYVTSVTFDEIRKAAAEGRFLADESGIYKVRLAWDGRTAAGRPAASGPYHMRLILKFDVEGQDKPKIVNKVFTLGFKRSVK